MTIQPGVRVLCCGLGVLIPLASADAAVRYVKADANGGGNGSSWTDAYTRLEWALNAAAHGDEIWVAAETYDYYYTIPNGVKVYGGFAGWETSRDQRDHSLNHTVLQYGYVILQMSNTDATTRLDGFIIQNGSSSHALQTAAIYMVNGSPVIANCLFQLNLSQTGYVVRTVGGSPWFVNCTFKDNGCTAFMNESNGSPHLVNCVFLPNVYPNNAFINSGYAEFINCTFAMSSPYASRTGSGVLRLTNCLMTDPLSVYSPAVINNSCIMGFDFGQANVSGTGNISTNPRLVGPTDPHLTPCSPCIDAGNNSLLPADVADLDRDGDTAETIQLDLDSNTRLVDSPSAPDTGVGTPPLVDMGAYEMPATSPVVVLPIIYVRQGATGTANGSSWADAFPTLHAAIERAELQTCLIAVTQIWVAAGTYTRPDEPDGFIMMNGVAWYGGFSGNETSLTQRNPSANSTNLASIATARSVDATAVLDGFSILNPYGSLSVYAASPTVRNCRFVEARVTLEGSNAAIIHCSFENAESGALGSYGGSPVISGCTFRNNGHGQGSQGAVFRVAGVDTYSAGTLTLANCSFEDNVQSNGGGALWSRGSNVIIQGCTFLRNSGQSAGACYIDTTYVPVTVSIRDSIFRGNVATATNGVALYCGNDSDPALTTVDVTNSIFTGNSGGGVGFYHATAVMTNCTVARNHIGSGGRGVALGFSPATIMNCIFWGHIDPSNQGSGGPTLEAQLTVSASQASLSHCIVQGLRDADPGQRNRDVDPLLTSDGFLRAGSPAIDAALTVLPPEVTTDVEGDSRMLGLGLDIGADEYVDSDGDGLRDAWESAHGQNPLNPDSDGDTTPDGSEDFDGDGLSNLNEYGIYHSNIDAAPYFVDGVAGNDNYDGRAPTHPADPPGNMIGPMRTFQAAINAAASGDTVLVLPGTYSLFGDFDLDFSGKSVILRSTGGSAVTRLQLPPPSWNYAFLRDPSKAARSALVGFTVIRSPGAGSEWDIEFYLNQMILDDVLVQGTQPNGADRLGYGANFSAPTVGDVALRLDLPMGGYAGGFFYSDVHLMGTLSVDSGDLRMRDSLISGPGAIELGPNAKLDIETSGQPYGPTVLRSNVIGNGDIHIGSSQELRVQDGAVIDLSGSDPGSGCADPTTSVSWGTITVAGKLLVQDASIQNTNVDVLLATFLGRNYIINNDIRLKEQTAGYGGEFFVSGDSTVQCNVIESEGDRYLDVDPDPAAAPRPLVQDNMIHVLIKQGVGFDRGELLELRSEDYDHALGGGGSGAFQLADSQGYADTWALQTLEVLPDAKVTLTNRPGFVFQNAAINTPEVVYVRLVKLHAGALLNTGLQRLYYQSLVDENGAPLPPDTNRITDQPLLGFSLKVISMDDQTPSPFNEFDIRMRSRLRDPADMQDCRCDGVCANDSPPQDVTTCREGSVQRLTAAQVQQQVPSLSQVGGVMEMRTQAVGRLPASSVAAKGAFARAGHENITITFDYLFMEDAGAEVAVSLSDHVEAGVRSFEVARLRMPVGGRPGSVGNGQFGTFYGTFPRATPQYSLNFTRGTYVELALIASRDGSNNPIPSRIWIDNFDPQIICSSQCADLSGEGAVTGRDYLLLLAEFGQTVRQAGLAKACMDNKLSEDQYVDLADLIAFDTLLRTPLPSNACGPLAPPDGSSRPSIQRLSAVSSAAATPGAASSTLVIAGKSGLPGQVSGAADALYTFNKTTLACIGNEPAPPAGGAGSRANGRLIADSAGNVYQLHGTQGLLRYDGSPVISPAYVPSVVTADGPVQVHVGVNAPGGQYAGLPLADAAFHPSNPDIVYVVPVLVTPTVGCPYQAAARLQRTGSGYYSVQTLYGRNPHTYSSILPDSVPDDCFYWVPEPDRQRLREIEVDGSGHVFVLSAQAASPQNDWVLIYDESAGNASEHVEMIGSAVPAPTSMLVSSGNRLYLTSSVDPASFAADVPSVVPAQIHRFEITCTSGTGTCLNPLAPITIKYPIDAQQNQGYGYIARVTAMTEDASDGRVYVAGFTAPRFSPTQTFSGNEPLFTLSTLASFSPGNSVPVSAQPITCHHLTLPLSLIIGDVGGAPIVPADFNADGRVDADDFDQFKKCGTRDKVPYNPASLPPDCTLTPDAQNKIPADFDEDGDVDENDLGTFQRCYSGSQSNADYSRCS